MQLDKRARQLIGAASIILFIMFITFSFLMYQWIFESNDCKIIKIFPKTQRQHDLVAAFYYEKFFDLRFVTPPVADVQEDLAIQVPEKLIAEFERFLNGREGGIPYEFTGETAEVEFPEKEDFMSLGTHNSYSSIVKWMNQAEIDYQGLVETFVIGETHEHRDIIGLKIGKALPDVHKKAIWIDGGVHAREWESVHAVVYYMFQLVTTYGLDVNITKYVDTFELYVVPVLNPDGYEFSRSAIDNRLWRRNKSPKLCNATGHCCQGVDLNRNFDVFWGVGDSSNDSCSHMFRGLGAFSEPESRAVRDLLLSKELKGRTAAFITMHSFGQLVLYADTMGNASLTVDSENLRNVGNRETEKQVVTAISKSRGTIYQSGTAAQLLYTFSGSHDWAALIAEVPYSYCIEMVPRYNNQTKDIGFMLPKNELIPTAQEVWEGVKVIIEAAMNL